MGMKRITKRGGNGATYCDCLDGCYQGCQKVLGTLAAYEDAGLTPERVAELAEAERDGRLVVLPCKVGDTVYFVPEGAPKIADSIVLGLSYEISTEKTPAKTWVCIDPEGRKGLEICELIGETVFLKPEAAEAALMERKDR